MKCPHCNKKISRVIHGPIMKEAEKLHSKGFSIRRVHYLLREQGYEVSVASLGRYFKSA